MSMSLLDASLHFESAARGQNQPVVCSLDFMYLLDYIVVAL